VARQQDRQIWPQNVQAQGELQAGEAGYGLVGHDQSEFVGGPFKPGQRLEDPGLAFRRVAEFLQDQGRAAGNSPAPLKEQVEPWLPVKVRYNDG